MASFSTAALRLSRRVTDFRKRSELSLMVGAVFCRKLQDAPSLLHLPSLQPHATNRQRDHRSSGRDFRRSEEDYCHTLRLCFGTGHYFSKNRLWSESEFTSETRFQLGRKQLLALWRAQHVADFLNRSPDLTRLDTGFHPVAAEAAAYNSRCLLTCIRSYRTMLKR